MMCRRKCLTLAALWQAYPTALNDPLLLPTFSDTKVAFYEGITGGVSSGCGRLGWFVYENKNQFEIANVFAGVFSVIIIVLLVENFIFRSVETRTIRRWGLQS